MPFNRNNQSDGYLLHISKSLNRSLKSFSPDSASPLHPLSCNFPGNRFCWVCFPPGVSSESLPQLPHCNHSCALKIGSKFHLIFFFHLILWCPAAVNIPVPPYCSAGLHCDRIYPFDQPRLFLGTDNMLTALLPCFFSPVSQSHEASIKNAGDVTHLNIT